MEENLKKKTGQSLQYWIDIVKKSGITKHKSIIEFLKSEHNFTYGFANFVALKAKKADAASIDDQVLISNQYKGKESLIPIFEHLKSRILKLGQDITMSPKKDSVSFVRKKQFVLIKPTKKRIDLGLKIKGRPFEGRLEDSGPFGTMVTHRVRIESLEEVDAEIEQWIKEAYDASV